MKRRKIRQKKIAQSNSFIERLKCAIIVIN